MNGMWNPDPCTFRPASAPDRNTSSPRTIPLFIPDGHVTPLTHKDRANQLTPTQRHQDTPAPCRHDTRVTTPGIPATSPQTIPARLECGRRADDQIVNRARITARDCLSVALKAEETHLLGKQQLSPGGS